MQLQSSRNKALKGKKCTLSRLNGRQVGSRRLITCQARLQASSALLLRGLLDITATLHEGTNLNSCNSQRMSCLSLQVGGATHPLWGSE